VVVGVVPEKTLSDVTDIVKAWFAAQEGEGLRGVSKQQVAEMKRLDQVHGREKFLDAVKAWLGKKPWLDYRKPTMSHLSELLDNFPTYLALVKKAGDDAKSEEQQKHDLERAGDAYSLSAMCGEKLDGEFVKQLGPGELERYERIRATDYWQRDKQDLPFLRDIRERERVFRKAEPDGDIDEILGKDS
jgi:hypothetical protein